MEAEYLSIEREKALGLLGDRRYDPDRFKHHPRIGSAHGFEVTFGRTMFPARAIAERNPLAPTPWWERLGLWLYGRI